jgi:hypothetical protein
MATSQRATCLVTIHGIGFQQPPLADGTEGYADKLHRALSAQLGADRLSDDPQRQRDHPGDNGPIYVQSHWPPGKLSTEPGLERLGKWSDDNRRLVETAGHPLLGDRGSIAHIALVYSNAQDLEYRPGSAFETACKALVSFRHYSTMSGALHQGFVDVVALLPHHAHPSLPTTPSLRIRNPTTAQPAAGTPAAVAAAAPPMATQTVPNTPIAVMHQLMNDVTTYVCRDELRTRLRSFVHDAILRLCCREDVDRVIVNSHSQGTVVAFDVLRQLPPFALAKMSLLITAGSPLRKYADMFAWGDDASCLWELPHWINFWDVDDPVADPLVPPPGWQRGTNPLAQSPGGPLFHGIDADTGELKPIAIEDRVVDNVANTPPGGLPAHNYWDNEPGFVVPVADLLRGF